MLKKEEEEKKKNKHNVIVQCILDTIFCRFGIDMDE